MADITDPQVIDIFTTLGRKCALRLARAKVALEEFKARLTNEVLTNADYTQAGGNDIFEDGRGPDGKTRVTKSEFAQLLDCGQYLLGDSATNGALLEQNIGGSGTSMWQILVKIADHPISDSLNTD